MNINVKLKILDALYNIHNQLVKNTNFVCNKFCSYCCSCNLTATTLEVYKIIFELKHQKKIFLKKLNSNSSKDRFIPKITLNKMAKFCADGKDLPEENIDHNAGVCFALSGKECSIYENRPFSCRSMLSSKNCEQTGFASIDPYMLAVHNVFSQYIEHIDTPGYTCNFYDLAVMLTSKKNIFHYENGNNTNLILNGNLIKNQTIQILMIPPEYTEKIKPLLNIIKNIKI